MKRYFIAILIALFVFVGCTPPTPESNPQTISLSGYAQKGQLIKGSQISVYALDENLVATGESFPATISDDMGSFAINGKSDAPFLELSAQGYYYNENRGELSESPIYLSALIRSDMEGANINLLTSLTTPRIKALMSGGMSFEEASTQAEAELLSSFGYDSSNSQFAEMNISGDSEADGLLLAASCLIQSGLSTAEIQSLITEIASSLASSGSVPESLRDEILAKAEDIEIVDIVENLIDYYTDKDIDNYSIPPFYYHLDPTLREGLHFITNKPINVVFPGDTPIEDSDISTSKEGGTFTDNIICSESFTAESNCDWIEVEVEKVDGDIYRATTTIACNTDAKREGKVLFKSQSGELLEEVIYIQGSGRYRLYIEGPSNGNGSRITIEDTPRGLEEGDWVVVNNEEYTLKKDEFGLYAELAAPAEVYRVVWPVNVDGDNGSFSPIELWDEDYYYCTVHYPEVGYPQGVYPYYGLLVGNNTPLVKMRPMFAGIMVEVKGAEVVDNRVTITADQPMFGTFTYSNYIDEMELILNPSATLREPVIKDGIASTTTTLSTNSNGDLTTPLLLIPAQNYNFSALDKQIKQLTIGFSYIDDGEEKNFSLDIPTADHLSKNGSMIKLTLSNQNGEWKAHLYIKQAQ